MHLHVFVLFLICRANKTMRERAVKAREAMEAGNG